MNVNAAAIDADASLSRYAVAAIARDVGIVADAVLSRCAVAEGRFRFRCPGGVKVRWSLSEGGRKEGMGWSPGQSDGLID